MHEIYYLKYLMEFELKTYPISYLCWLIYTICGRADTPAMLKLLIFPMRYSTRNLKQNKPDKLT